MTLLAVLVGVWEMWVRAANIDPSVMAPPSRVAQALIETREVLGGHILTTLTETLIGLVIGIAIGIACASAIATSVWARRALEPLLVTLQTIPPIVLAPTLVLALGFGQSPRIVVVVLIVLFPVAIAAAGAFRTTDRDQIDLVRSLGATRWGVLRTVTLPGSVPAIFDGVRISAAYAVGGAAIAEQLGGATSGIGLYIARSQRAYLADQVIAGVVVIAVLSLVVYAIVVWASRAATPWLDHSPLVEAS